MDRENAHQQPALRERIGRRAWVRSAALVGSGLIAGGIVAGTVPANAADNGTTTPESSTSQVTEAVPAGNPDAEIERAETESGGGYEAHIVAADEERLTVLVDENLRITGTEEHGG